MEFLEIEAMNLINRFNKICKDYDILAVYIFGSMSKEGIAILNGKKPKKIDSLADIDLGIVFFKKQLNPNKRIKVYSGLYLELSDIFSPFTLDLVFLQETGIIIQFEAINGILAFAKDKSTTPRAWPTAKAVLVFFAKKTSSIAALSGLYSETN